MSLDEHHHVVADSIQRTVSCRVVLQFCMIKTSMIHQRLRQPTQGWRIFASLSNRAQRPGGKRQKCRSQNATNMGHHEWSIMKFMNALFDWCILMLHDVTIWQEQLRAFPRISIALKSRQRLLFYHVLSACFEGNGFWLQVLFWALSITLRWFGFFEPIRRKMRMSSLTNPFDKSLWHFQTLVCTWHVLMEPIHAKTLNIHSWQSLCWVGKTLGKAPR